MEGQLLSYMWINPRVEWPTVPLGKFKLHVIYISSFRVPFSISVTEITPVHERLRVLGGGRGNSGLFKYIQCILEGGKALWGSVALGHLGQHDKRDRERKVRH